MDFQCKGDVQYPAQLVYETMRDKLPELVPYLPNVERITQEDRKPTVEGRTEILNRWRAKTGSAPAAVQPFLKPEMLEWYDHALWKDADVCVDWWLEAPAFRKLYACRGTNRVVALGDKSCSFVVSGTLTVNPEQVPGVPTFIARKFVPLLESYLLDRIRPNMEQLAQGVGNYLAAKGI
jgi:hypothetical protein